MRNQDFENVKEALQLVNKLELLLKQNMLYNVRDLDEIQSILLKMYKEKEPNL